MNPGADPPSTISNPGPEPTLADKILAILDQIRTMDKTMDEARTEKIANIKKALAEGTYHVSASDVAGKIIDKMEVP